MSPMRLPRTIRMDVTDSFVFDRAAEPGEWAVSGAFAFADAEPGSLAGKRRPAFTHGFLGVESFGWSTFVTVASADDADAESLVEALASHFVECYGAPSREAARAAAAEEVRFAASLCHHPVNTVLTVERRFGEDGIVESFRVVQPARERDHARIWEVAPAEPEESVDLVSLTRR